ncbi:MAG: HAD family hydrolase [Halobacteriota archaeon]
MPRTDAVLFDLDGTLCVHEQDGEALLQETFETLDVEPFTDQQRLREAINEAPDADDTVSFMTNAFDIAAQRAGVEPVPADTIAETYIGRFDHTAVSFREGARQALASVGDRPVGLVTNGERAHQWQKLETLGLTDTFDTIVYGGETTPSKPSPEPFEIALGELGVEPDATIHVGNSLSDDIAGANRVGVRSVWVPTAVDREERATAEPVHTLKSLQQLPTVF